MLKSVEGETDMKKLENIDWQGTFGCTVLLIIGFILEIFTPLKISTWFYLAAVVVGGFQLTIDGIKELIHDKRFNVDLLMIIAALGAGLIGDWREGALLIFIFSLSHVMEEYATYQSKRESARAV